MEINNIVYNFWRHRGNSPDLYIYHFLESDELTKSLTFSELDTEARKIAAYLQSNYQRGDRALLLYPPGLDFLKAFWGCLYAGIIAVPVPLVPRPELVADYIHHIQSNSMATCLLTNSLIEGVYHFTKSQHPHINTPPDVLVSDKIEAENPYMEITIAPADIALLQYTSGSIKKPKGVIISHENLFTNTQIIKKTMNLDTDIYDNKIHGGASWLPHFHDMGLIGAFLTPSQVPGALAFMSPLSFIEKPVRWLKMISDYKSLTSPAPNFAFEYCTKRIKDEELEGIDLSHWKVALTGSEPIHLPTIRAFSKRFSSVGFSLDYISPCYGMAEATLLVSSKDHDKSIATKRVNAIAFSKNTILPSEGTINDVADKELISCGPLAGDTQALIIDTRTSKKLPINRIGEIYLSGLSISRGYWNNEEASKESFGHQFDSIPRSFFKTGDLGFLDDKGELYVTGRIKELIIVRGKNYYPFDIEWTLFQSIPEIRKGCVAAVGIDKNGSEELHIIAEIKSKIEIESYPDVCKQITREVTKHCGLSPSKVMLVAPDSVPKTSSGKVQRLKAKELYLNGSIDILYTYEFLAESENEVLDLVGKIKNDLAKILSLHPGEIADDDNIFDLGLESIQLPALLDQFSRETGIDIPFDRVLEVNPNILAIAEYIIKQKNINSEEKVVPRTNVKLPDFSLLEEDNKKKD